MESLPLLVGWAQWDAIEVHPRLEQLQYLRTLVHSLLSTRKVPTLQFIQFEFFEGRSSFFVSFSSFMEGDSIQPGDQVGILSLA